MIYEVTDPLEGYPEMKMRCNLDIVGEKEEPHLVAMTKEAHSFISSLIDSGRLRRDDMKWFGLWGARQTWSRYKRDGPQWVKPLEIPK